MITIVNATENNLKNVTLNIPSNKLIVVTGVSGSGKSTLVYDVIFKEARRRYLESFSANAQQFLGKLDRPNVQFVSGLLPAIALQQNASIQSSRSTVGTLTELYDLLRLLFARSGQASNKSLEINRSLFSFNTPKGACAHCKGLGVEDIIDPDLLIADENKTIRDGAFTMTTPSGYIVYSQVTMDVLNEVCKAEGFSVDIPWKELNAKQKEVVLFGSKKIKVPFGKHPLESRMKWSGITAKPREEDYYKGIIPVMEEILRRDRNVNVLRFARSKACSNCKGARLNENALSVYFHDKNIAALASLSINELIAFFEDASIYNSKVDQAIIADILNTAKLIQKLGLGFLSLDRPAQTLSGGETQRLRLAKMVSTEMRGILYVFDEPSIGLHPKETKNLIEVLYQLKNNGNTVLLVEHNQQVIQHAEWIIDLGPEAGFNGGKVLFNGASSEFLALQDPGLSKTLLHLKNDIAFKHQTNEKDSYIEVEGASGHNLKSINARFKLAALNVVTGLSGSGKSTLVDQTLARFFQQKLSAAKELPLAYKSISGAEHIQQLQIIDQKAIGKTPRSNPATYIGLSDEIRNLFAALKDTKNLAFEKKHFSFNTKGGRCEKCEGAGYEQIGMQMLGRVEVLCSKCNGKQFKNEVLAVKYRDKTIADIYKLTIDEAFVFFEGEVKIQKYLAALQNIGLGYLKLNQRSSSLSGGEARRVKLAKALVKIVKKPTLYIIDEPASGLHAHDIQVMLQNLQKLVDLGHTIVLVEQNHSFIKAANHLIELGLESGVNGGSIVFQGLPKDILKLKHSNTAQALRGEIKSEIVKETHVFDIYNPISIEGLSTHNLKNIDVEIPVNKITSITGVSGSGKSSLAFDTLFTEGRQRYAESFSAYMRNRLNINSDAQFNSIKGLMPTIAVNQQSVSQSERSTVGTMTDIYDYLRLLFARVGKSTLSKEQLSASHFSFNHEQGACEHCQGLGYKTIADAEKLISNAELSILNGAMNAHKVGKFYGDTHGQYVASLKAVGAKHNIDFSKPWKQLTKSEKDVAMLGTGDEKYQVNWEFKRKTRSGNHEFEGVWEGLLHHVNEEYLRKVNDKRKDALLPVMSNVACPKCTGKRLNTVALSYKVLEQSIDEITQVAIKDLLQEFRKQVVVPNAFSTNPLEQRAAQIICGSIINGLDILDKLGLGYLTLARQANTLSGGEGQRVRLAAGLAQDISGVCFVLDEPTTGMHPKDLDNLFFMLHELKRQGNTVVVCEHDPGFIRYSDHVIELGPGAGKYGGSIIEQGEVKHVLESKNSLVAKYLKPTYKYARDKRSPDFEQAIKIEGAHANNLKHIDVSIPTKCLTVVKGLSGSGKSSLIKQVLYQSYKAHKAQNCKQISGLQQFSQILLADQSVPKGHSLSFIASYLNIYAPIKDAYAKQARVQGSSLKKAHFSLAGKEGKCTVCAGKGFIKTPMDFLSDVYDTCEECQGQRFSPDVLAIRIQDTNIATLLNMQISELEGHIELNELKGACQILTSVGLGYLSAGQTLNTLSGGELQRLKLAKTLMESKGKPTLFLLDEPTTGLHMHDVEQLMTAFDHLLDSGHSLIAIEHHKTLIDGADYVIELGPGAGAEGGIIVE